MVKSNTNYFSYSRAVPAQEQLIPEFKNFMKQQNVKSICKQTNICNLGFVTLNWSTWALKNWSLLFYNFIRATNRRKAIRVPTKQYNVFPLKEKSQYNILFSSLYIVPVKTAMYQCLSLKYLLIIAFVVLCFWDNMHSNWNLFSFCFCPWVKSILNTINNFFLVKPWL